MIDCRSTSSTIVARTISNFERICFYEKINLLFAHFDYANHQIEDMMNVEIARFQSESMLYVKIFRFQSEMLNDKIARFQIESMMYLKVARFQIENMMYLKVSRFQIESMMYLKVFRFQIEDIDEWQNRWFSNRRHWWIAKSFISRATCRIAKSLDFEKTWWISKSLDFQFICFVDNCHIRASFSSLTFSNIREIFRLSCRCLTYDHCLKLFIFKIDQWQCRCLSRTR